jgi:predicted MFS family arabinose efflux permease
MTHTTRRTRTTLANLGALLLFTGLLVPVYRESTEFGNLIVTAFGLSLLVSLIVERVERRRPPVGTVTAAATLRIACCAYLVGDLIDSTAVRSAALVLASAGLVALLLRLPALLRRRH